MYRKKWLEYSLDLGFCAIAGVSIRKGTFKDLSNILILYCFISHGINLSNGFVYFILFFLF